MLLPQSLTSRALALNKGTIERCGKRDGGTRVVLAFGLAFDRRLIKGCKTLSVTWGLMGDMHA